MRLRTEMVQEIDDKCFRRHLGERLFRSGSLFCRFWGLTWIPDWPLWTDFRPTFVTFWPTLGHHVVFLRSTVLGEGAGIDFGSPGGLPGMDFGRLWVILCVASVIRFFLVFFQLRPKLAKFQISRCSTVCITPMLPCPSVAGAVVSRSVLNSPYPDGVLAWF